MFWSNRPRSKLWHGEMQKRGKSCPQVHSDSRLSSIKQLGRQCLSQPVLDLRMLVCPAFGLSHTNQEKTTFSSDAISVFDALLYVLPAKKESRFRLTRLVLRGKSTNSCVWGKCATFRVFFQPFLAWKREGKGGAGLEQRFMKAPKPEKERKSGWASFRLEGYQLWSR